MPIIPKDTILENIHKKFAYIESYIRLSNEVNLYDVNIQMENFAAELLNRIYDYELVNENAERKNAAGVDLLDKGNAIAVQVTSQTGSDKIRHTIKEFLSRNLEQEYNQLIIFMIQPKKDYTASFDTDINGRLDFDCKRDVIDFGTLMKELTDRASYAKVLKVCSFLENNVEKAFPDTATEPPKSGKERAQDYREHWNKYMFLENPDTSSAKKLQDMHRLPSFQKIKYPDRSKQYGEENAEITYEDTNQSIEEYFRLKIRDNGFGLIFGLPGIGKSTLYTWLLNQSELGETKIDQSNIYLYRFCDMDKKLWELKDADQIVNVLVDTMKLDTGNVIRGKIFLWDGFDEVICDELRGEIIKQFRIQTRKDRCTVFVTCRENYFTTNQLEIIREVDTIRLCPFSEEQIVSYIQAYTGKNPKEDNGKEGLFSILTDEEYQNIFGLPVILYMTLSVLAEDDTTFGDKKLTLYQVYERIFALDGGIYDRMAQNDKSWDAVDGLSHERTSNPITKGKLHDMSKELGIWMFMHLTEDCPGSVIKQILNRNQLHMDDLSGGLFHLKYLEVAGKDNRAGWDYDIKEARFVHRTIFEYFTAKAIVEEIETLETLRKENLAEGITKARSVFGQYLHKAGLYFDASRQIKQFLEEALSGDSLSTLTDCFEEMLDKGMLDRQALWFKENPEIQEMTIFDIEAAEYVCFLNMLTLLQLVRKKNGEDCIIKLHTENISIRRGIERYLELGGRAPHASYSETDLLNYFDLSGCIFDHMELSGYDLSHAILDHCSFIGTDLSGTRLPDSITAADWKTERFAGSSMLMKNKHNRQILAESIYPGKLIEFGHYPHTMEEARAGRTTWSPISWRVLDIKNGSVLLLSEKVLEAKKFHEKYEKITWRESSLCKWLNTDFLEKAFDNKEEKRIITINLPGEEKGNKVFLLSEQEVCHYFGAEGFEEVEAKKRWKTLGGRQASAWPTPYAKRGVFVNQAYDGATIWWLRSLGGSARSAIYVSHSVVFAVGASVDADGVGVRPALWLKLVES